MPISACRTNPDQGSCTRRSRGAWGRNTRYGVKSILALFMQQAEICKLTCRQAHRTEAHTAHEEARTAHGGWRGGLGAVRAEFERALAVPAYPAIASAQIASELRRSDRGSRAGKHYPHSPCRLRRRDRRAHRGHHGLGRHADHRAGFLRRAARDEVTGWEVAAARRRSSGSGDLERREIESLAQHVHAHDNPGGTR
jgi:hypothetical protein